MEPTRRNTLRRTACDNCRQQRLKCLRDQDQASCQRCVRLDKSCQMAATRRPGRPKKSRLPAQQIEPEMSMPEPVVVLNETLPNPMLDNGSGIILEQESFDAACNLVSVRTHNNNGNINHFNTFNTSLEGGVSANFRQTYPVLTMHQCLKDLSELNIELHAQGVAAEVRWGEPARIPVACCPDPSYLNADAFTYAEKTLIAFQKFYDIISNVEWLLCQESLSHEREDEIDLGRSTDVFDDALDLFTSTALTQGQWEEFLSEPLRSSPRPGSPKLETALVLTIISCYVQLISIFSVMSNQILNYLKRLKSSETIKSVNTVRFFQVGSLFVRDGRLQGLMYCTLIIHYLDRSERVLGLLPEQRHQRIHVQHPLLGHPQYREFLEKELQVADSTNGINPRRIRDIVEDLRRTLAADPSW